MEENGNLFLKEYSFKVFFNEYSYNFYQFAEENMKVNPIIPEIQILNLISNIAKALYWLQEFNLPHLNISAETIFLDFNGLWIITAPNHKKISLKKRFEESGELIKYLIPKELSKNSLDDLDLFKCDLFSLGITIINRIYPFHRNRLMKHLDQSAIDHKMQFFKNYYSKDLFHILKSMVYVDHLHRVSLSQLIKKLKIIQRVHN